MFRKIFIIFAVITATAVINPFKVEASEGTFELQNQVGESARCYATSILMSDQRYRVILSCRDILYPGGTEVFNYVLWGQPNGGGNPFRVGTLQLGKVEFRVSDAFNRLFVTKELDDRPRKPEGTIVMSGNYQRIEFLDGNQVSPVTSLPDEVPNELISPSPEASPTTRVSQGRSIFRMIAAGGIVAFLGLFGVILVIFVITRR